MPIPIPLLVAGASLLGEGINAVSQGSQNRKDRAFAREQYDTQRRDALADWAMQNEYNSPASQMERLKAAGLNPNLVYGSGVNQVSQQVRSSNAAVPQGTAVKFNPGSTLSDYQDAQVRQAQVDNLKVQNTVLLEEQKLKAAQTISTLAGVDLKQFEFDFKTQNRNVMLADAIYRMRKLFNEANLFGEKVTTEQQMRTPMVEATKSRGQLTEQQIVESRQRVLNMVVQQTKTKAELDEVLQKIENLKRSGQLQELELKLRRMGVSWNDPAWQRKLIMLLNEL